MKVRKEVMGITPYHYNYDCVAGNRVYSILVTAVMDGSKVELDPIEEFEYANNHTPNTFHDSTKVAQQLAELDGEVKGLIVNGESHSDFDDSEEYIYSDASEFENGLPDLFEGSEYEIYIPIVPIDWTKVRRRLEDLLRKDQKAVKKCAALLDINLD
jgi:hypothetical protein